MRNILLVLLIPLLLCGCLQSQEKIEIQPDGKGSLEVSLLVPNGTVQMVDTMLGGMMQGMADMMGGMVEGMAEGMSGEKVEMEMPPMPKSVAQEMFANKDEILKKAKENGLKVDFDYFESKNVDEGLYVTYKLNFDDIVKFKDSEIGMTKFDFFKNDDGNIVLMLLQDEEKTNETQAQMQQLGSKEPETPQEKIMMEAMMSSMKSFKIEFSATMPLEMKDFTGVFKKEDANTAGLEFAGDMLNPEFYKKMEEIAAQEAKIVWKNDGSVSMKLDKGSAMSRPPDTPFGGAGDFDRMDAVMSDLDAAQEGSSQMDEEGSATIYLANGEVVNGDIVSRNDEEVKLSTMGMELTYYMEDIERIEE